MSTLDHLDEPSFDTQASSGNNGHQLVNSDDEFNSDLDDFPMELDDSNLHSNSNAGHLNRIPGVGSSFNKVKNSFSNAFFFRQPRNSFSNFNLQPSTDNFDDEDYEQYNVNHGYNIGKKIEYEDLSAIDWQMEYAKERERKKKLELQPGFYGKFLWLLDISHIWIVLILTGISVAFVAAFIDVVSRWLGDVKFGHCTDAFYLPREYCCSGIDLKDECPKWVSWETSFHLRHDGVFGYILSYLFYLVFTVMFAVAASILVLFYAPHARFSGMPEIKTILSGFVMKGFLDSYSADDASSIGGRQDADGVSLFEFDGGHNHAAIGASSAAPVNLREWAELDPMTLSWESSLQLAASMFAKLGLRFILFTDKGQLCGLLTRKDVWLLLNSLDDLSNSMNEHFEENSASTSSLTARGRLLSTLSYSLRGSEDEVRLLAGQDDDYDETHQSQESA
ncbi:hypothetical protein DV495_002249 [Geotrichum candidum]|nr:hypothetical protein DV452_001203 [Geotrichum candidum]KAF5129477.1 hypothetical protein DV495_002249 [Geotrichum candidum]KAI9211569.1 hypothetical protein DS838_003545 [Geotrichum bryndzae]